MKKLLLAAIFLTGILKAQDHTVQSIGYVPPHSYMQNNTFIDTDDIYSDPIPVGFNFEFYGVEYTELLIGGNDVINFNASEAYGFCLWQFEEGVPNIDRVIKNSIYGAFHDLLPENSSTSQINYAFYQTAPNRIFVINFYQVAYFQYTEITATSQIVLYKTTNNIFI